MSLTSDARTNAATDVAHKSDGPANFRFIPRELAAKCRTLIDSYHNIYGYSLLPDMLWHSDGRDIIECCPELAEIFKNASRVRSAKRANESFLLIATVIVSIEVLARDFAGWGKQFPAARRAAEELLVDYPLRQRVWFMDKYLYPSLGIQRDFTMTSTRQSRPNL